MPCEIKAFCFEHLGRTISWELRKLRKDGEALWVRETARAMLIKNRPVVLVVSEDVTEGKRAAEAYRRLLRPRRERPRRRRVAPHFEHVDDLRKSSLTFSMPNSAAPTSPSSCCPYRGFQRRWTCPIGAVIGDRVQTVHSAQRGRAKGVRPSNGVDEP